jgi:hypothetical protein
MCDRNPVALSLVFVASFVLLAGGGEAVAQGTKTVTLPKIVPPEVEGGQTTIGLPAAVDDVDVGGGGRYLALHFKTLRKIGVLDVNTLTIEHYIPANEDDARFAAGATKLLTVSGDRGVVSRYDLATGQRELSQSIDLGGSATRLLLGSASAGPAFAGKSGGQGGYDNTALLVDLDTLESTPRIGQRKGARTVVHERVAVRAADDGEDG